MNPVHGHLQLETRRHFFRRGALGLGVPALTSLLARGTAANAIEDSPLRTGGIPELPHFAPKAKRAIYLFMSGAPSQLDLFDTTGFFDDKTIPDWSEYKTLRLSNHRVLV